MSFIMSPLVDGISSYVVASSLTLPGVTTDVCVMLLITEVPYAVVPLLEICSLEFILFFGCFSLVNETV